MERKELDRNILALIGKAIKEGKYLDISYKNEKTETTRFWISILDIFSSGHKQPSPKDSKGAFL